MVPPPAARGGCADRRAAVRDARVRALLLQARRSSRRLVEWTRAQRHRFLLEPTVELATAALIRNWNAWCRSQPPATRGCAIINRAPLTREPPPGLPSRHRAVPPALAATRKRWRPACTGSARPYLFVDVVNIAAQRYFAIPGNSLPQEGGLDVSFDLYGYLRPAPAAGNDEAPRG